MLKYHNDGKGKSQSHEVYESDFDVLPGYGATKKQAFLNFKHNVEVYIENLKLYHELDLKEEHLVEVDCSGEPIK